MAKRTTIFRVVYTSIYILLYVILLGLLLITPADAIERSLGNGQQYNVWLIIFSYVAAILVVCFIYFLRLYVNRTELAAIPKAWIPIEPGDLKKRVHAMIVLGLDRSAAVAYEARPREAKRKMLGPSPPDTGGGGDADQIVTQELGISRTLQEDMWRNIEHHGWAPPTSPDLPNLNYATVLSELPHLIEAKALTLAPRLELEADGLQRRTSGNIDEAAMIDPEAAALLQRTPGLSLRGYIDHLQRLGVLGPGAAGSTAAFLHQYEHARFSRRALSNAQFRELMRVFAEVLRSMDPLNLASALRNASAASSLSEYSGSGVSIPAADEDDEGRTSSSSPASRSRPLSRSATNSTQDSIRRPLRSHSLGHSYRTAPTTPHSRRVVSRSRQSIRSSSSNDDDSSSGRFTQTRRPYVPPSGSNPSSSSQSLRSQGSSSVIRLATEDDEDYGGLPYVLNLSGTMESLNATPR